MRKQTKLVAVLSAAALLAIGASMTSFAAAAHWDQQDGEWVFVDRNGDRMTDVWKKSNGQWYYLDSDGYMAKEQVIEDDDDKYYVDANGARVTNAWVSLDNDDLLDDDDESESIDTVWMYFDATGKALGAGTDNGEIKRLPYGDGKSDYFIFNQDGYMLSGWKKWDKAGTDKDLYYLGSQDEGWARTNWHYLEIDPDISAFDGIDTEDSNYKDECWFFFKTNGKAYKDDTAKYNNRTYAFDEYGRMLDLWVYPEDGVASDSGLTNAKTASSSAPGAAYYTEEDGGRIGTDWILAYPNTDYDNYGDDLYYFYVDAKGRPFRADDKAVKDNKLTNIGTAYRVDDDNAKVTDVDYSGRVGAKAIKNQTYLFNNNGVMLTGLFYLGADDIDSTGTISFDDPVYKGTSSQPMSRGYYYFTEDSYPSSVAGQMVTNKRMTLDIHGDDKTYYFDKSGRAYQNTVINGYLYGENGQLITDNGDGNTYQMVTLKDAGASVCQETDSKNANYKYNGMYVFYDKSGNVEIYGNATDKILINENGKLKQGGSVTDVNEVKVSVSDYIVTKIGDNVQNIRKDK